MLSFIHIENFKCFDLLELRLAPLTLIAGVNGAGKSTVIQSLLMLRQSILDSGIDQEKEIAINGSLIETGSYGEILYSEATTPEIVIELDNNNEESLRFILTPEVSRKGLSLVAKHEGNLQKTMQENALFSDDFVYLYADRMHPMASYTFDPQKLLAGRLGNRYGNNTPFRLMEAFNNGEKLPIPALKFEKAESVFVTDNVSEWIGFIMGSHVAINTQEDGTPERVKIEYSVEKPDGDIIRMSPLNMPFGHSYILPIVLAVLTAKKGSLVIIENPESHLHPSAQTKMGLFLSLAAHNGVQIIIETHSDHLMNGVRIAVGKRNMIQPIETELCFVTLADDNYTHISHSIEILPDGSLDSWPKGFFDEWEMSLNTINHNMYM